MLLIGAGGHAGVIASILKERLLGCFDDYTTSSIFFEMPIRKYDANWMPDKNLVVAIGDNRSRKKIIDSVRHSFGTVIADSATLAHDVKVEEGSQIIHGAIVQTNTRIGKHTIVNTGAIIDHDCSIGDFCHVAPNSTICGGVSVGEGTLIGAGSTVAPGVKIGKWCKILAGTVVIDNVEDGAIVKGNPGRVVEFNKSTHKIYLSSAHIGGTELSYIMEDLLKSENLNSRESIELFEDSLKVYNQVSACSALSSGTAALHLALILLGVEQDDEVLCSTFTFSATVNAIAYQKANPIFIDSEKDTWNMCPETLETAIKDRIANGKKPKAIIIVHLYGMPSKMDELIAVCAKYDIPIIEDAAEALGASYRGKKMGTFGELGVYSFNGNKIITTSGGGALVSDNEEHIKKATFLATQARDDAPHYEHSHIGYNYRMSNVLAGIGRGQMEVLDKHITLRREMNTWYQDFFADYPFIEVFKEPNEDFYSNHWLTCILVHPNDKGITRETIRLAMNDEKIECRPLWKPMHQQPIFKDCVFYGNGISDKLFEIGLCMPSGSNLSTEDKARIDSALVAILGN